MPTTLRHGRSRGFTLIELLVVISIIALLIGLILPALGRARQSSRQIKCMTNVRSIGQALRLYTPDYKSWYPHWSGWHVYEGDGTGDDAPGPAWTELLRKYIDGIDVFQDPDRPADIAPFAYFLSARYSWIRYGRTFTALRDSDVRFSAEFVLGGDCNQPMLYAQPYGTSPTQPDCDQDDASQLTVFFGGRDAGELTVHGEVSNLLFFDGHVAGYRAYDPTKMTWHGSELVGWDLVSR